MIDKYLNTLQEGIIDKFLNEEKRFLKKRQKWVDEGRSISNSMLREFRVRRTSICKQKKSSEEQIKCREDYDNVIEMADEMFSYCYDEFYAIEKRLKGIK